jgi:hypothetical protein
VAECEGKRVSSVLVKVLRNIEASDAPPHTEGADTP